jgi:hypothetical protein
MRSPSVKGDSVTEIERTDRIALHLKEAQTLRRIAAVLNLRSARVLQAAVEHEQLATALGEHLA